MTHNPFDLAIAFVCFTLAGVFVLFVVVMEWIEARERRAIARDRAARGHSDKAEPWC